MIHPIPSSVPSEPALPSQHQESSHPGCTRGFVAESTRYLYLVVRISTKISRYVESRTDADGINARNGRNGSQVKVPYLILCKRKRKQKRKREPREAWNLPRYFKVEGQGRCGVGPGKSMAVRIKMYPYSIVCIPWLFDTASDNDSKNKVDGMMIINDDGDDDDDDDDSVSAVT